MKKIKEWICKILSKVFRYKKAEETHHEENVENFEEVLNEENEIQEEDEIIKSNRSIISKLNYLETRIQLFITMFPEDYKRYKLIIDNYTNEYQSQLDEYIDSYKNKKLTFSIDPEDEAKKLNDVYILENNINTFINTEFKFKSWIIKLSELCYKLNVLYNASIDSEAKDSIFKQSVRAITNLETKLSEIKNETFFKNDVRKKTQILEYVFYSSYLIFKLFLRCNVVANFANFKEKVKVDDFFETKDYDINVLKFIIDDINNVKKYINNELQNDKMYSVLKERCEKIERQYVENEDSIATNNDYFSKMLKHENTICGISKIHEKKFNIPITTSIDMSEYNKDINLISVKEYAVYILKAINNTSAKILLQIVENIENEMNYEEFFFMCKIFDLCNEVEKVSLSDSFSNISCLFRKFEEKYKSIYSDDKILEKKHKVLRHKNDTGNEYVPLIEVEGNEMIVTCKQLDNLFLDYRINGTKIYLNQIYFNGFENIEKALA